MRIRFPLGPPNYKLKRYKMITTLLKLAKKSKDKRKKKKVSKEATPEVRPRFHTVFADKINHEDHYWFV